MKIKLYLYNVTAYIDDNTARKEKIIAPNQTIATYIMAKKLNHKYRTCIAERIREATEGDIMEVSNE